MGDLLALVAPTTEPPARRGTAAAEAWRKARRVVVGRGELDMSLTVRLA